MNFISPKVDYAFKKIFGSEQSQAILISFLNAIIYGGHQIIQSLTIKFEYPDAELQLFFIELPKFKKTLSELSSLSDKWIYFIKEAATLDTIPDKLGEVNEIELALTIANQAEMTVEELEFVDRRAMMLQDEKGRITYAQEEGRKEGQITEAIALILRQLKKRFGEIPMAINSQVEALSLEDLESLGEDFLDFNSWADLEHWLEGRGD
ncbi:PD-(D/E)XK nuclease family transposase [Coleofasciculus sp.]|uniref:PD-(D/E)XK nuclease family transposase n=1 Tax=Coleofasciculus sp. TaxID=3100458 RepID=UPI003A1721A0